MSSTYEAAIPGTIWNETARRIILVNGIWQLAPGQTDAPFVDDKSDPGGPTKWGQSQRQLQKDTGRLWSADEIAALTVDYIVKRWQTRYWNTIFESINAQNVASKILDINVNAEPPEDVLCVQRACADLGQVLSIDGDFGGGTLTAVNSCDPQALINQTARHQLLFYRGINNPAEQHDWYIRASYLTTKGWDAGL